MTHHEVPDDETAKLQKIAARQKWLFLSAQCTVVLSLATAALRRVLGERYDALSTIVAIALMLGAIGVLVYLTCFQRCPRCAGWIVIPKCPDCGLEVGEARRSA